MRWLSLLLLVALAWLAWALVTLPPAPRRLRLPAPVAGRSARLRGAFHVHSKASDGTGTLEEIAGRRGPAPACGLSS